MDGDGDMDVLSASYRDDKIAWYENDGNEAFTAHPITTAADGAIDVLARDVDGDGDMDVLSASYRDDTIAWHENDGQLNFTSRVITSTADYAFSVFAADVDGDGDLDVLSASRDDDRISWYENDGSQVFSAHTISTNADSARDVMAADMDGDGDMDVLSASRNDHKVAWYENDGQQNFSIHNINTATTGTFTVFPADMDGDQDLDVLSASHEGGRIVWFENQFGGQYSVPLSKTAPHGSLVHETTASRFIRDGVENRSNLQLDAGQTVSVLLEPQAALRLGIELRDSQGDVVESFVAAESGQNAVLQSSRVDGADTYQVAVRSLDGGDGAYDGRIVVNAAIEPETYGGSSNDDVSTASDLEPFMFDLPGGVGLRAAVIGSNAANDDWFRFSLSDGEFASVALQSLSGGESSAELYKDETLSLASSRADSDGVHSIPAMRDATRDGATDDYFLRVTGAADEYNLVVTRGATLAIDGLGARREIAAGTAALGYLEGTGSPGEFWRDFSVHVVSGDTLDISTFTPAGGPGEFVNRFDPRVLLYNPARAVVAGDMNGAADGRNVELNYLATTTGEYIVRVLAEDSEPGEYVLQVDGQTGEADPFSVAMIDPADGSDLTVNPPIVTASFTGAVNLSSLDVDDVAVNGVPADSMEVVGPQHRPMDL